MKDGSKEISFLGGLNTLKAKSSRVMKIPHE